MEVDLVLAQGDFVSVPVDLHTEMEFRDPNGEIKTATANIPIYGEVKSGKVVYAYEEDRLKGADLKLKDSKAKAK